RSAERPAVRFGVTRGSGARVLGHLGSRRGTARGAGYPRRRYSHLLMGTHVAWRVEERQARCPHTRGNGPGMQAHGASAGGRDTTHLRLARGQYFVYSRAVWAENHLVEGGEDLWRSSTGASRGATCLPSLSCEEQIARDGRSKGGVGVQRGQQVGGGNL